MDITDCCDVYILPSDWAYIFECAASARRSRNNGQPYRNNMVMVFFSNLVNVEFSFWISFAVLPKPGSSWLPPSKVSIFCDYLHMMKRFYIFIAFFKGSISAMGFLGFWTNCTVRTRYSVRRKPSAGISWCWVSRLRERCFRKVIKLYGRKRNESMENCSIETEFSKIYSIFWGHK